MQIGRTVAALITSALAGCGGGSGVGSIGVMLERDAETRAVYVRDVPEVAGAAEPLLFPGDELLMVEGVYVRELSKEELRRRLRGAPSTKVRLTLVRGAEVVRVEVPRVPLREALHRPERERLSE